MRRVQKVSAVIQKELAILIEKSIDKNLGMVTLTHIKLQPDLKQAIVYISCLNPESEKRVWLSLQNLSKDFQQILGKHLKMKYTPKITFMPDRGLENVNKVGTLLEKINQT